VAAIVMGSGAALLEARKDPKLELGLFLGPFVGRAWAVRKDAPQLRQALARHGNPEEPQQQPAPVVRNRSRPGRARQADDAGGRRQDERRQDRQRRLNGEEDQGPEHPR